jgi:hypothetical protein
MKAVRPRALKHRGTVDASGFVFDRRLIGIAEARRRVLAVWTQGAQVFQLDDALLVRLPSPQQVSCAAATGAPLVKSNDVLLAAPLAADELKAIDAPGNSVVLVRGGAIAVVPLFDSISQHPADWLDVELFKVIETSSLGAPPAAPRIAEEKPSFDARQKLDGVPSEAPELAEVLAALRSPAEQPDRDTRREGTASNWREGVARMLERFSAAPTYISGGVARLGETFRGVIGKLFGNSSTSQTPSKTTSAQASQQPVNRGPSLGKKLSAKLRQWAARMLIATRLSRVIGKRQARYVYRMMEMFERGDLQEALRHAIPIDGLASALSSPALNVPTARASLSLSPYQARASSSIYMGDDLLGQLRRLYRASFERLEAQGRIEEAAFVLAELLQANEEAVAFLERHGKLKLAAEMAEGRDLAPGLVVRQWFMAGDKQRAVMIARRTKAFADAVIRLERTDKKQAEILRLLWSGALAEAGEYAVAVEVVWPIEAGRNLARDWLEKAIEMGGTSGARMLARKLSLLPQTFDTVKEQALVLLEDESLERASARLSFANTLKNGERTPQARTLARAAIRAVLRDAAYTDEAVSAQQFRQLIDFAADAALRSDAPPLPVVKREPLSSRKSPLQHRIAASDVGTAAIHDLAFLPDGRTVVALGEAGARLLTRDGRTVAHFDQPAHRLVLSDNGDRAIALAKRGEVWRLARLDFLSWRSDYWVEARIDAFANDYDGSMWFIGAGEDFYAIDATAKRFDAIWRVPDIEGSVLAIARSSSSCRFLIESWGLEEWHYELPSLRLRSRYRMNLSSVETGTSIRHSTHLTLSADGALADNSLYLHIEEGPHIISGTPVTLKKISMPLTLFVNGTLLREIQTTSDEEPKPIEEYKPVTPSIFGNWVAASVMDKDEARVLLIDGKEGKVRAEIVLEKATTLAVRVQSEVVAIADNRGRVLVMEINSGHLIRNLRI